MELLIPVINKLQRIFSVIESDNGIPLPEIVVVGAQSSGKSSVLEGLVGKSFLPRGSGIVTRCPIVLQLVKEEVQEEAEGVGWKFTFDHEPEKIYTDFDLVRQAIEKRTDELTGHKDKGITDKEIFISIASPNAIPLTVVDLPGIVKLRVGEQSEDIENEVRDIILNRIKNPNAIILAVSPANADIATSESLKMAKEVDPKQERTLAVMTKLDLMDKGTNAEKLLRGEAGIKVKHGFVGIVNRSQDAIKRNVTMEKALDSEKKFFKKNYSKFGDDIGIGFLAKRLNHLLFEHIKNCLPELIKLLKAKLEENSILLRKLGPEILKEEKQLVFEGILRAFVESFEDNATNGEYAEKLFVCFETFSKKIRTLSIESKGNLSLEVQRALINAGNHEGFRSLSKAVKNLSQKKIIAIEGTSKEFAKAVHALLSEVVDINLKSEKCLKFPKMRALMRQVSRDILEQQEKRTEALIHDYLDVQKCLIFSLEGGWNASKQKFESKIEKDADGKEEAAEEARSSHVTPPLLTQKGVDANAYCRELVTNYCKIIQSQVGDFMPKLCNSILLEGSIKELEAKIRKQGKSKEQELISEPSETVRKRKETLTMIEALKNAQNVIDDMQMVVNLEELQENVGLLKLDDNNNNN